MNRSHKRLQNTPPKPALDFGLIAGRVICFGPQNEAEVMAASMEPGPQEAHSMLSSSVAMRTSPAQLAGG